MLKNTEELKIKIKESLEKKAEKFIDDLNMSEDDFTIDAIEDIMIRFNEETNNVRISK